MGMNDFSGSNGSSSGAGSVSGSVNNTPNIVQSDDNDSDAGFLINYNEKFKASGKAMFRDSVVSQTMSALLGMSKPNALLVGPAGTGKTKIVEDLAFRIANSDPSVPDKLHGSVVYELPLSCVVSNSSISGMLEKTMIDVVDFFSDPSNNAIMFIDEIHQLFSHDTNYTKIAQILKPALARGDMRVIGATTVQEATSLMSDPAFNRRFSRIIVDELNNDQTVEVLRSVVGRMINHYGNKVSVDDSILPDIVSIANKYHGSGNHRPDTAITLLDRTCGDAVVSRKAQEVKAALDPDPNVLKAVQSVPYVAITSKQLKRTAITIMTGHSKKDNVDEQVLREKLSVIKGQDDIVNNVVSAIVKDDRGLYPRTKPLTLLFAGASGVGKTEITKIIADELTGAKPITLNMPEFHSHASINRIIGSPVGYAGSESNAELPFDALESNPYQVILLDEFEKASKAVQTLFMSAFDEGWMQMSNGRTIDFSKAIIVATTNASFTSAKTSHIGFDTVSSEGDDKRKFISDLSHWFPPELLNRFSSVMTFNAITKDVYRGIVSDVYARDIARIKMENRWVSLPDTLDDATLDKLVNDSFVPEFGARPAAKAVKSFIEDNA